MNIVDIFSSLRYKLPHNEFSDYQIVDSINYVVREISLALNSVTSSLITASVTLPLVDGTVALPADFESLIEVKDKTNVPIQADLDAYTYKVLGNAIYAQGETITLSYRKSFPQFAFDGETFTPTTLDLPVSFMNIVRDNVLSLLTGSEPNIQKQVLQLASIRDGKKRPQRLAFYS